MTSPANRSKALAHVGIAFAISFCIGPPIGAYFASRPLPPSINAWGFDLNVYAAPALLTLVLLSLETAFLVVALPETRGKKLKTSAEEKKHANGQDSTKLSQKQSVEKRIQTLKALRRLHFFFLSVFSGVEFTLTFLTFDRMSCIASNALCTID